MSPGTRRTRIGRGEARRLLEGAGGGGEHAELAELLAAAAGPAMPGEHDGVEGVVAAYRAGGAAAARSRRRAAAPRRLVPRVAAIAVVALAGAGVAAAETNELPSGWQRTAHSVLGGVGVPAPQAAPLRPAGRARTTGSPESPAVIGPTTAAAPTSGATTAKAAPSPERLVTACRAIEAGTGTAADEALAEAAAGKANKVDVYCKKLLESASASSDGAAAATGTTAAATTATATATNTHGKGHAKNTKSAN